MKAWVCSSGLLGLLAAVLTVAGAAQAEGAVFVQPDPGQCMLGGGLPRAVEAIYSDAATEYLYYGTTDGEIRSIHRTDGEARWTWSSEELGPGLRVLAILGDSQRIYAVLSNFGNGQSDPVVALSKADGTLLWSWQAANDPIGPVTWRANDVFRIAQDPNYIYAAPRYIDFRNLTDPNDNVMRSYIYKVQKADGQNATDGSGAPLVYKSPSGPVDRPNAIYAMWADGNRLWAGRNFGGPPQNSQSIVDPLATSILQRVVIVDTSDMTGRMVTLPAGVDNQVPGALPGVWGIWADPNSDGLFMATTGATDNQSRGIVYQLSKAQLPADGGALTPANSFTLPIFASTTGIMGDGTNVYVTSRVNQTSRSATPFLNESNVYAFSQGSLDPQWLRPNGDLGRRYQNADAISVFAEYGPAGRLWVGHDCMAQSPFDPYPSAQGPIAQRAGGLLMEVPKGVGASGILMFPNGGEMTNGTFPIGFRTDYPSLTPDSATVSVSFEISFDGGTWYSMNGLQMPAIRPNSYLVTDNVALTYQASPGGPIQVVPEGDNHRLRMNTRDPVGNVHQDWGEYGFTVDRTPPALSVVSPAPNAIVSTLPTITVATSDALSDVDTFRSRVTIDGVAYPFLQYSFDTDGRVAGFRVDLNQANQGMDDPARASYRLPLSNGLHAVRVESIDRARNFAFAQFSIRVDDSITPPAFLPAIGSWVNDGRPRISAQFMEDVTVESAIFDGVSVADRIERLPQHAQANPLGARLFFQPEAPVTPNVEHQLVLHVRDTSNNVGGPYTHRFKFDAAGPVLRNLAPAPDALIVDARPRIGVDYADADSGLAVDTLNVYLDGFRLVDGVQATSSGFTYEPATAVSGGTHSLSVTLQDAAGNTARKEWSFQVDLGDPAVDLRVSLPSELKAVKRGEDIVLRIRATDESGISSVAVDAQGLNSNLKNALTPVRSSDSPDLWEITIRVEEARTRSVTVKVFATDRAGHVGSAEASVLVDNTPPVSFLKDLPPFVGATFFLGWENDPPDTGSGVAYYIVERQEGADGAWRVLYPRVEGTTAETGFSGGEATLLRFRVTAVDHAGNVQAAPSNAVETIARGDPFEPPIYPSLLRVGTVAAFSAEPARGVNLTGTRASVELQGPGGVREEIPLERVDRVFSATWDVSALPAGDYVLRFHFWDASGAELLSKSYPVRVTEGAAVKFEDEKHESPGLEVVAALAGIVAAGIAAVRRGTRRL